MKAGYKLRLRILALLIALFIIGPPILSIVSSQNRPQIQVTESDPIEGLEGYSVDHAYFAPTRSVEIYTGTVLDNSADWVLEDSHYQVQLDRRGIESVTEIPSGVRVQLAGYHKAGENYYTSDVLFRGMPTFPMMNYTNIDVSVDLSVIRGYIDVSLHVWFKDTAGYDWKSAGTYVLQGVIGGDDETLTVSPDFSGIQSNTTGWIVESEIEIEVTTNVPSDIIIGEVSIVADSEVDLYPASFDLQAFDGESLFSNGYMARIGGHVREEWTGAQTAETYYLGARLTNTGNEDNVSLFYIRRMNETFYLREGTYSGFIGWLEFNAVSGTCIQREGVNITFTVSADESTGVAVQLPATRLYLTTSPNFAYTRVEISTEDVSQIYYIDLPLYQDEYLYLPPLAEFNVRMAVMNYDYRHTDQTNDDFNLVSLAIVTKDTDSNTEVTLVYPQLDILGFTFSEAFILGVVALLGIIIMIILSIKANEKWTKPELRPSLIPLTVIFISVVTPWVNYSFFTSANPETHIVGNIYIPLLTTLWSSAGSSLTLAPNSYLLPNVGVLGLLFWLPIVFFLYQMIYKKRVISIREMIRKDSLVAAGLVLGPFVLGAYYFWFCINNLCSISIGLIAAVGILPAWIVAWHLEGKRSEA